MLGQGFIEQFVIHPHDDEEDWLNADFSDPDGDPDNTENTDNDNLPELDKDDEGFMNATRLNQVGYFDIDGTPYGHVYTEQTIQKQLSNENDFELDDPFFSPSKIEEESAMDADDEDDPNQPTIFAAMNAYHMYTMRKRVNEANEKWLNTVADDGVEQPCRSTKVRFNQLIEVYSIELCTDEEGDCHIPGKIEVVKSVAELRPDSDDSTPPLDFNCLFSQEQLFPIDFIQERKIDTQGLEISQAMETTALQPHGDFLQLHLSPQSEVVSQEHIDLGEAIPLIATTPGRDTGPSQTTVLESSTFNAAVCAKAKVPVNPSTSAKAGVLTNTTTPTKSTLSTSIKLPGNTVATHATLSTNGTVRTKSTLPATSTQITNTAVPIQSGNPTQCRKHGRRSGVNTIVDKAHGTATVQKETQLQICDPDPKLKHRLGLRTDPKEITLKHSRSDKAIGSLHTTWDARTNLPNTKVPSSGTMVTVKPLKRITLKNSENKPGAISVSKSQQKIPSSSSAPSSARCSKSVKETNKIKLCQSSSYEKVNRIRNKTTPLSKSNFVIPLQHKHPDNVESPMNPILQCVLEHKNLSILSKPCGQCPTGPMFRELKSQILKHNVQKSSLQNSLSKKMLSYIFEQNSSDSILNSDVGHRVNFQRETLSSKSKSKAVEKGLSLDASSSSKWASKPDFTNKKNKRKSNQNCGEITSRGRSPKITSKKLEKDCRDKEAIQRKSKLEKGIQSLSLRKECLPFAGIRPLWSNAGEPSMLYNTGWSQSAPVSEKKKPNQVFLLKTSSKMARNVHKT